MFWTISIEYDSVWMTFTDECPLGCVKQLLTSAIKHDHHDLELFEECFELMERIQDDPQDEYQIVAGDMSDRWKLILKPSTPAGWDKAETSVEDTTVYDCSPVSHDHEFADDCERID